MTTLPSAGLFIAGRLERGSRKDTPGSNWYGSVDVGGVESLEVSAAEDLALEAGFQSLMKAGNPVVLSVKPRLYQGRISYGIREVVEAGPPASRAPLGEGPIGSPAGSNPNGAPKAEPTRAPAPASA